MTLNPNLPIVSGTPYQEGTTFVMLAQTRPDGERIVSASFGNQFSATIVPLTLSAANELHRQLTDALRLSAVLDDEAS